MNRISIFIRRDLREIISLRHGKMEQEGSHLQTRKSVLTKNQNLAAASSETSGLQSHEKEMFAAYTTSSMVVLLQHPKQTSQTPLVALRNYDLLQIRHQLRYASLPKEALFLCGILLLM